MDSEARPRPRWYRPADLRLPDDNTDRTRDPEPAVENIEAESKRAPAKKAPAKKAPTRKAPTRKAPRQQRRFRRLCPDPLGLHGDRGESAEHDRADESSGVPNLHVDVQLALTQPRATANRVMKLGF